MGFIFNDGGSDRAKRGPPPSAPSRTLKETLRDVPSPFDNHSHFSFLQSSLFSLAPLLPPPSSELPGKYSYVQLNFSHWRLGKQVVREKYLKVYIPVCLCPIVSAINIRQEIQTEQALKILPVAFMLIWNCIRSCVLNKLFLKSACFLYRSMPYKAGSWE